MTKMKVVVLSHDINQMTPLYGGRGRVAISQEKAVRRGDSCNLSRVSMSVHASTHVDLPYHFIEKGKTLEDYTPNDWIFDNVVVKEIEIGPSGVIDTKALKDINRNTDADLLIIKTGYEKFRGKRNYIWDSPVVSSSLAHFIKVRLPNLKAVGFDFISLSSMRDRLEGRKAHRSFLKNDIIVIEDMKLSGLNDKPDYILISPLCIKKIEASPVTVWAFYHEPDFTKYKYIFCDCDGVILDSVDVKTEAFKQLYRKYGKDVVNKVTKHHTINGGMSRYDKFRLYHKDLLGIDLKNSEVLKLAEEFSRISLDKILKINFVEGAIAFLSKCKQLKKKCFLVSATPVCELKKISALRGLNKYFSEVRGSPESKTVNIRQVMRKYKISAGKAVFIGDSINDVTAANANGIKFIGINYHDSAFTYKNFINLVKNAGGI